MDQPVEEYDKDMTAIVLESTAFHLPSTWKEDCHDTPPSMFSVSHWLETQHLGAVLDGLSRGFDPLPPHLHS